ncbi:uncharacterized protein LOC135961228 [Calliphora vicina]|uniref:uncharacterized protein LOC135961228 n=1 Tax=Calliphora vicina TaxID=7373 RepID=UPI00325BB3BC
MDAATTTRDVATDLFDDGLLDYWMSPIPHRWNLRARASRKCPVCNKNHPLRFCYKFRDMSMERKLRTVALHRLCSRCLSSGHTSQNCKIPDSILEPFLGFQLADPTFNHSGNVALVLGPEVAPLILKGKIHTSPGLPLAQYTIFGWIISGLSPY